MKQSALSFLLVLLIEAACAVASYLKDRLMRNMHRNQQGFDCEQDFA